MLYVEVYVKYYHEEDAERALGKLTGRFYSGKLIQAALCTVHITPMEMHW